ncbi:MAG TPA: DUF1849 family protein [Rhabdaerophilum sp.]|nr:DUF1849 family protein [Rhabdaerophilum sp.]
MTGTRIRSITGLCGASLLGVFAFGASGVPALANPAREAVMLQPHRIAYEVSLGPKSGNSSFTAASGLIALEFTGNACKGYETNFRQATLLADTDGGNRQLDFRVRLWEDGGGKSFRFNVLNRVNGQTTRNAEGEAKRVADGSVSVALKRPRGTRGDFDGAISFPSAMMIDLLAAARNGQKRFDAKVFDGSEGGEKVYQTVGTIGEKLEGERNKRLEPVMRGGDLDTVPRWVTSIAYFDNTPGDKLPVYTLRSVTFANGVLSDLVFEFPDFSLVAKAVRYEPLQAEACRK